MPTRTASSSGRRRASSASPATRSRARGCCCNSASSKFPDGLANSSGQVGQNYMRHMTGSVYAIFDKPVHMYRGTTMAGIIQDEARTIRRAASSAATRWRRCRSACRSWRPSSIPAPGAATSPPRWTTTTTWPACGSSARTCRRRRTASRCTRARRTSSACRSPNVHFDDHRQRRRDAQPRLQAGHGGLRGGRRDADLPDAALSLDAQSRHQPDEREAARRRRQQVRPDARHQEPVRLGRQPVHHRRRRRTRR